MKYIIEITETLQRQIEVEAQNESEAISLIKEKYKHEEIIYKEDELENSTIEEFSEVHSESNHKKTRK